MLAVAGAVRSVALPMVVLTRAKAGGCGAQAAVSTTTPAGTEESPSESVATTVKVYVPARSATKVGEGEEGSESCAWLPLGAEVGVQLKWIAWPKLQLPILSASTAMAESVTVAP